MRIDLDRPDLYFPILELEDVGEERLAELGARRFHDASGEIIIDPTSLERYGAGRCFERLGSPLEAAFRAWCSRECLFDQIRREVPPIAAACRGAKAEARQFEGHLVVPVSQLTDPREALEMYQERQRMELDRLLKERFLSAGGIHMDPSAGLSMIGERIVGSIMEDEALHGIIQRILIAKVAMQSLPEDRPARQPSYDPASRSTEREAARAAVREAEAAYAAFWRPILGRFLAELTRRPAPVA
ncbi:MAG: hypothetical protein HYZ11_08255 [Candidatus Tectomicrobia bacterium]|uniref:Uncharacterized protein n=1 Tax=Tectimicrobiota bacterium TaxID=2528274 RepID=A0A932I1L2_UNCTE|nr:hypothetical protein [Candidatus Tectomicrobia bacterium]